LNAFGLVFNLYSKNVFVSGEGDGQQDSELFDSESFDSIVPSPNYVEDEDMGFDLSSNGVPRGEYHKRITIRHSHLSDDSENDQIMEDIDGYLTQRV